MKKVFLPFLLLMMLATTLRAGEVSGLYSLSLLVPSQSTEPSVEQAQVALSAVLVKVAGNRQLLGSPEIQQALEQAPSYLKSFAFHSTNRVIRDEQGTEQLAQKLALEFDESLVNALLQQSGESALGSQRPTLMLWLAAEQQGQRDYLLPESQTLAPLMQSAAQRGLPLQMPLLDLTDQQALSISSLWGLFADDIKQASSRYRPDATLAGRMTQLPGKSWYIEWLLLSGDKEARFVTEGGLEDILREATETVADQLFANMGQVAAVDSSFHQTGIYLDISNVRSLRDYISVTDYMSQLSVIAAVHPAEIDGSRVLLKVELKGSLEQLQQAISLEPRLSTLDTVIDETNVQRASLLLRWQG